MRRAVAVAIGVALVVLGLPLTATASVKTASLIWVTETSAWTPPSPDPMGVTYDPVWDRLLVVDSEVEEIPALFTGTNGFIATTDGTVVDTFTTTDFTPEPSDITPHPSTAHFFISSDGPDRTFEIAPGPDGVYWTSDDARTQIRTLIERFSPFPAHDVEGIAFGDGALYMALGTSVPAGNLVSEIYEILRGQNGLWSGSGRFDNVVTHWDTEAIGQPNPEGVAYDPETGHLLIVSNDSDSGITEATTDGALVGIIEISHLDIDSPSGVMLAPAGHDGPGTHLYITDRGHDNVINPDENDGRLFELALTGGGPSAPADLTNPGDQESLDRDVVSLQVVASDLDGDQLVYSALGLPPGLSIDLQTGLISGTLPNGAATGSPYAAPVFAGDGTGVSGPTFTRTVTEPPNTPPDAADDAATVDEDSTGNAIDVLANDTDIDSDALTIAVVADPPNGTAAIDDGGTPGDPIDDLVTYTPDPGFVGTDSFTYDVDDGSGGTDTATVTVTVEQVNDAPDAVNDAATV